jgi:hypothetical protein
MVSKRRRSKAPVGPVTGSILRSVVSVGKKDENI